MENFYRPILKSALNLSWRYKFLWFFGLFAALLGNGGEYNLVISNLAKIGKEASWLETLKYLFENNRLVIGAVSLVELFKGFNLISLVILVLLALFFIFLLWLIVVSQAGLLSSICQLYQNKERVIGFWQTVRDGKRFFWPVLWFNIIAKVLIYLFLLLISAPLVYLYLIASSRGLWWFLITFLSFLILIPGTFVITLVLRYAIIRIVSGEGQGLRQAFAYGWVLFKKNWLISLETAFLLFIINILLGFLMIVALFILLLPFILIGAVAIYTQLLSLFWVMLGLGLVVFFMAVIFFGALLSTFQNSAWVKVFIHLSHGEGVAKVVRWFSPHFESKS
jgi:hypothetical protein